MSSRALHPSPWPHDRKRHGSARGGLIVRADGQTGPRYASLRSAARRTFPLAVFGSSAAKSTIRGYL